MKLKLVIMGAALSALVGCNTTTDYAVSPASTEMSANDAYTVGMGQQVGFVEVDKTATQKTAAEKDQSVGLGHNQTFYFDFDSNTVHQSDLAKLHAQARYIAGHPNIHIRLEGNTDERGSREYNIALGERRALGVADILKLEGVTPKQMHEVSYGEEKPVVLAHKESAYRKNRRVELIYEELS